jgi:hypothetical protein
MCLGLLLIFLNSSNQRIGSFSNYCKAKGCRPRKFGLDMDVRWNSTYLMLKHLLPYKSVFSVFINTHYGYPLLNEQHWVYFLCELCSILCIFSVRIVFYCIFSVIGLRAGPTLLWARAFRAGPARKTARWAVPGPLVRHAGLCRHGPVGPWAWSCRAYLSGTIIRGTLKTPKSQLVTSISTKLQRPDGYD